MRSRLPRTTPEVHEVATEVAITCRLVVQAFMPPDVWREAERRFYLTVCGVLEQAREGRQDGA